MRRDCYIRILLLSLGVFFSVVASAQYLKGAGDRASINWRQIKGDTYKVIFPKGEDSLAIKYLWLLEQNKKATMLGLDLDNPAKVPVVLHNRTANSNGLVTWAPKRMELYTIPTPNTYPHIWEEQLAIHEARHVGQMTYFTKGIFKVGEYIIGEQSPGLGVGLYGGTWNLEGDAVVAETELTHSGRGRNADFLEYHRLSVLEGDFRRPQDWKFGSYKHFSSSHYEFGYMINSSIRYEGNDYKVEGKIFDKTVKKFYTPVVKKIVYRTYAGRTYQEQFSHAQNLMGSIWREDLTHRGNFTKREPLVNKTTEYYVEYTSPIIISADSILYVKNSYENASQLVLVSGGKEKVLRSFSGNVTGMNNKGNLVYFAENINHVRWGADVYSNVYVLNTDTYKISQITKKRWYYEPQVSGKTDNIMVIEYLNNGKSRLVILDPKSSLKSVSNIVNAFTAPDDAQITSATWSGDYIYMTALSAKGLAMYRAKYGYDTNELLEEWQMIIKPQTSKISDLSDEGDYLYFSSDMDGVNNIYKLQDGKIERITNDKYGASSPYVYEGYIYYTAASSDGYYPVKAQLCSAADYNSSRDVVLNNGQLENLYVYPVAERLSQQAKAALEQEGLLRGEEDKSNGESGSIVKFTQTKEEFAKGLKNQRYSKLGHLFKFHSWAPFYYDIDNLMALNFDKIEEVLTLGVTLYSQNTLGNAISKFGYSYWDGRHAGHLNFVYSGQYPIFEVEADINTDDQKRYILKDNKLTITPTGNPEFNFEISSYIPFTFNSHGLLRGITPQIKWSFSNNYFTDSTFSRTSYMHELSYGIQGYIVRPTAHSAIYPKWGLGLSVKGSTIPSGSEISGNSAAVYGYGYLPGFFSKHGVKLTLAYQRQWVNMFYMSNLISEPRGFKDELYADKYFAATFDYAMPIYVGNLHIPSVLFIKRFQLNPFFDFANTKNIYNNGTLVQEHQHYSFGATFKIDCHVLGFGAPISAGIRYARNYSTNKTIKDFKKNHISVVASVDF